MDVNSCVLDECDPRPSSHGGVQELFGMTRGENQDIPFFRDIVQENLFVQSVTSFVETQWWTMVRRIGCCSHGLQQQVGQQKGICNLNDLSKALEFNQVANVFFRFENGTPRN
jgi:hypothetical protein